MSESTKPSGWPVATLRRLIEKQQALAQECAAFLKELEDAPEWIPLSNEEVLHIKRHHRIPMSEDERMREQADEASAKIPTSESGQPTGAVKLPPVSQFQLTEQTPSFDDYDAFLDAVMRAFYSRDEQLRLQTQSEEASAQSAGPDNRPPKLPPEYDGVFGSPERRAAHRERLRRLLEGPTRSSRPVSDSK